MEMFKETNWKEIWQKRTVNLEGFTIENSLIADGYDTKQSTMSFERLKIVKSFVETKVKIQQSDAIFEIGCGSGAFLYPWYIDGFEVSGIDFSEALIKGAKVLMPNGNWKVCDAKNVDTIEQYDYVLSYGVFLYFPDHSYAEEVVAKMLVKAKKAICIFDIPDADLRDQTETMRRNLNGDNYDKLYKSLSHLYFQKSWWLNLAKKHGKQIEIFQIPHSYESMKYRFSVIIHN